MKTRQNQPSAEELPSLDEMQPTEADIAAEEAEVTEEELARAFESEGLGKEAKKDDVRYMLDALCAAPLLTPEQERETARLARSGDPAARERLILANQRLVVTIAKRYRKLGMEFRDLVHEGNIGLMRAVERNDPDRGLKFCTYATWWIRQAILRSLDNSSRTIRIPSHSIQKLYAIRKAQLRYEQEHGRKPSNDTLSELTGIDAGEIAFLKHARKHPDSLHRKLSAHDEGSELTNFVADEAAKQVDVVLHTEDVRRLLLEALQNVKGVTTNDVRAYMIHAGFDDGHAHTVKQTAARMEQSVSKTKDRLNKVRRALRRFPALANIVGESEGA